MRYKSREPVEYTCPEIDDMIASLENLRKCNSELRDWGNKEAERVDELEKEIDNKNSRIDELEDTVSGLEDTIIELEKEIKELYKNQN